jgi:hypothetical protein
MKAAGFDEVTVLARIACPAGCPHILYSNLKEQSPESMRIACRSRFSFLLPRTPSRRTPISVHEKEREGVLAPSPRRLVGGNFRARTPSSLITTPSPRSKQSTTIKCDRSSSAYDFLKASQPAQFQLPRPNSGPDSQPLSKTRDSRRSRQGGLVGAEGNYREKRIKNTVTQIPCLNYDSPSGLQFW